MMKTQPTPVITTIHYSTWDTQVTIQAKRILRELIEKMTLQYLKRPIHLHYIFTNDAHILEINQKYLTHDYYTDIITFDLSDNHTLTQGEIYISLDTVKSNAKLFKVPYKHELLRVMLHGVLHLCGFKDKTKAQQKKMREAEDIWIQEFMNRMKETRTFKPIKKQK